MLTGTLRVIYLVAVACVAAVWTDGAWGAVTRIEIQQRLPYAEGREFPGVGPYERLLGRVHFAVDPEQPGNAAIVDLTLAPRNEQGQVEFSADLEILAPVDRARASGTLLYDVNNRGNRMVLRMFNEGADHFLMRQGMIVVWCGWIAELLPGEDRLRLDAPLATQDGQAIEGWVRAEMTTDEPASRLNIAGRPVLCGYPPAEERLADARLTWRLRQGDPRVAIPRAQWRLETTPPSDDDRRWPLPKVELVLAGGFQPGYLYELTYLARDPVVQGLGLAAIRDLVSFLRYEPHESNPLLLNEDGASVVQRTLGFGISQSGRCLRTMLHEGFNTDEEQRQVFDGMIPHVSGGGLGFFNHRFASPSRYAGQHGDHLYPCDLFPFTYEDARDPLSGREDGILRRCRQAGTVPKVFHIQNSAEYWHRSGSLVHTDPLGISDSPLPDEVRIYVVGGAQHGWSDDQPRETAGGQWPFNPTDYRPVLRALLLRLEAWVADDRQPPESRYPTFAAGTLVDWRQEHSGWQPLPGVRYPEVIQQPQLLDYGPKFATHRRITQHPPRQLESYRVLVPAYDQDNHPQDTILLPAVQVPLATFTGWNLRDRSIGAENQLLTLRGAYIPLPRTKQQRIESGDPRQAILERYGQFDTYLQQFSEAAQRLVDSGYLLDEDVPRLVERAQQWRQQFDE